MTQDDGEGGSIVCVYISMHMQALIINNGLFFLDE